MTFFSIAVLCVVALVSPAATNMLRHGEARFDFTDPAALILLGAALICFGLWTRLSFFDQKREL